MLAIEENTVDHQHRGVPRHVQRFAHASDITGRLDLVPIILAHALLVDVDRNALTPVHLYHIGQQPVSGHEIGGRRVRELTEDCDQHLVAGRQRVGDRRFPAASARAGKQKCLPCLGL
jgi:hypothetical protein